MINGVTYYTVTYHMHPLAHFGSYAGAVRFAQAEKGRRIEELEEMRAQLTSSEYRGELGSITHALLVREINIKFEDGSEFEAVKFEQ